MCKILIVDDEEELREMIGISLSERGHEVHEAADGQDALDWLEQHAADRPCLVILDLKMPTVDGWDLLASLRRNPVWQHLPVVVLSATIRAGAHPPVMAASDFWSKPIDLPKLDRVHEYCPRHCETWQSQALSPKGHSHLTK